MDADAEKDGPMQEEGVRLKTLEGSLAGQNKLAHFAQQAAPIRRDECIVTPRSAGVSSELYA
ncbi:MAG: hypothetical protein ABIL06_07875 [Pseudomonadota bacterium]